MKNGAGLALGSIGAFVAAASIRRSIRRSFKGGINKSYYRGFDSFEEMADAYNRLGMAGDGRFIEITPYQLRIWNEQKIVVCPHGLTEIMWVDVAQEFGRFEQSKLDPDWSARLAGGQRVASGHSDNLEFTYQLNDRDHIVDFCSCDHLHNESKYVPTIRDKRSGEPLVNLNKPLPPGQLYNFFPPDEMWDYSVSQV